MKPAEILYIQELDYSDEMKAKIRNWAKSLGPPYSNNPLILDKSDVSPALEGQIVFYRHSNK